MTPFQANKTSNEKKFYVIFSNDKEIQKPNFNLGRLVRIGDIRRVLSKGDSTNWSHKIYTNIEVMHDTLPSNRIKYLPERCYKNFSLPTKLTF